MIGSNRIYASNTFYNKSNNEKNLALIIIVFLIKGSHHTGESLLYVIINQTKITLEQEKVILKKKNVWFKSKLLTISSNKIVINSLFRQT